MKIEAREVLWPGYSCGATEGCVIAFYRDGETYLGSAKVTYCNPASREIYFEKDQLPKGLKKGDHMVIGHLEVKCAIGPCPKPGIYKFGKGAVCSDHKSNVFKHIRDVNEHSKDRSARAYLDKIRKRDTL